MFSSEQWLANSGGGFYNNVATTSLRCDAGSNPKLVLNGTSGNRNTWTWSCWVKRSSLGSAQIVFNVGVTGTDEIDFHFTADDQFIISDRGGHNLKTTQFFRDTSAWYNLVVVMDTVQSGVTFAQANSLKLYVNGVRVTSFASNTSLPDENDVFSVNHTKIHHIATRNLGDNDFNGYLAEMNLIDGTAIGETNGYLDEFGELKNGVWIPKNTSGLTFGNNGFRLQFKENGIGTGDTGTIGADTKPSGTKHHFTSTGIAVSDCNMLDSPENNFCTLNPLEIAKKFADSGQGLMTQSEGNLKFSGGRNVFGNIGVNSGKWYWEIINTSSTVNSVSVSGVITQGTRAQVYGIYYNRNGNKGLGLLNSGASETSYGATYTDDDIIGVALNMDASTPEITFFKNNASQGAIANANLAGGDVIAWTQNGANSGTLVGVYNFGQDGSFAGELTGNDIGDAKDGNGIGAFKYAPPSDFLALCTSNLPEATISPNADTQADEYFNTFIYSGNNDATRTFDIGFVSDWSWFKTRNQNNYGSQLYDSSRGETKRLSSNGFAVEDTNAEGLTDFNHSNTLLKIGTDAFINQAGTTMVIWNWKVGGGSPSSYTPNGASAGVSMQRNSTSGISIVTYNGTGTGTGAGDQLLGHGLQVNDVDTKPDMMIIKARNYAGTWKVWHKDMGGALTTDFLTLNTNSGTASTSDNVWDNAVPTSTLFPVGYDWDVNKNGSTYVGYFFGSVEGYSKFGSYTGNGDVDGTFVYLGFKPAWIMIKRVDTNGSWLIYDNVRNPFNVLTHYNFADLNNQEGNDGKVDFVSNGFKQRSPASYTDDNANNGKYIYLSFAENPFKYSNAH